MKTNLTAAEVEQFWQQGYLHLRDIFTSAEVERWRARALDDTAHVDELMTDEVLREIVLHPHINAIARDILGAKPVYYGASSIRKGVIGGTGWHKDNTDRYDAKAPDWQIERYPVLAYGVYMQDHDGLPEGLEIREGSHRHADITTGRRVSPPFRKGDLIIWTQRTTHSANSEILKGIGHRVMPNGLLWRALVRLPQGVRKAITRRHPETRITAIAAVSTSHPLLDRHLTYLQQRTYQVDAWREARWPNEVLDIAETVGLDLINPDTMLAGVGETRDDYQQLPY